MKYLNQDDVLSLKVNESTEGVIKRITEITIHFLNSPPTQFSTIYLDILNDYECWTRPIVGSENVYLKIKRIK